MMSLKLTFKGVYGCIGHVPAPEKLGSGLPSSQSVTLLSSMP
jgi:hypothetical protein